MKPVSVATCAHAFMMIGPLAKDPAKDLNDDRVHVVSFAAVIRVVTQRFSPLTLVVRSVA